MRLIMLNDISLRFVKKNKQVNVRPSVGLLEQLTKGQQRDTTFRYVIINNIYKAHHSQLNMLCYIIRHRQQDKNDW